MLTRIFGPLQYAAGLAYRVTGTGPTLVLLHGTPRTVMLTVVWVGALLGCLFRIFWIGAAALSLAASVVLVSPASGGGYAFPARQRIGRNHSHWTMSGGRCVIFRHRATELRGRE